jgi:hypothetical protein
LTGLGRGFTRAMQCRVIALKHESRRLMRTGELVGPRIARVGRLLSQAYLAEEGLILRTTITNYGDWRHPIRADRGPRTWRRSRS